MEYYKNYKGHKFKIKKDYDTTIYSFDIETTTYFILENGEIKGQDEYLKMTELEKEKSIKQSTVYLWTLGINNITYYGRTFVELEEFLDTLEKKTLESKKIFFIHNLSFEFNFLKGQFLFKNVFCRQKRKVMKCEFTEYNIECRCTYYLTNLKLEKIPEQYNLQIEKLVGFLDYNKIRHSDTTLYENELKYGENDCLIIYELIKKLLETYKEIYKIPLTNTGMVRRELKEKVLYKSYNFRNSCEKSININPHIYNLLTETFAGGYVHANFINEGKIINNVDSYDFCSSYPYIMCTHKKFPKYEFKKCNIKSRSEMLNKYCYLLVVEFFDIRTKYFNTFISKSKCRTIKGGLYDNGRIIKADYIEIVLTDIDFYLYLDIHKFKKYNIKESYMSLAGYLPKDFIKFVLEKYVVKTELKGIEEEKERYNQEKRSI